MSKRGQEYERLRILRKLERLAAGRVNDVVKLAYLDLPPEQREEIDGLDLTALTEIKRSGNGVIELKLTDRMAVLQKMLDLVGDMGQADALFKALGTVRENGEE